MSKINYRDPTAHKDFQYFNHPELRDNKMFPDHTVRLKLVNGEIKQGKDIGLTGERGEKELYVFTVLMEDGKERTWTVDVTHHLGDDMAKKDIQPGDVFTITYLGEELKTKYGMKSKYEAVKEDTSKKKVESEVSAEEAEEIFNTSDKQADTEDEEVVRIEDMDNF